jgi:serine protease AprX
VNYRPVLLRLSSVAFAAAALLSTMPAGSVGAAGLNPTLRVHPLLQTGAALEPAKLVSVIVQKAHPTDSSQQLAAAAAGRIEREFPQINAFSMTASQQAVLALGRNPNVRYITPDAPVRVNSVDTSQLRTTYETAAGIDKVWNSPTAPATGNGVTVAVLDTGVAVGHPDLQPAQTNGTLLAVNVNAKALGGGDGHGHGTHVVGTIKGRDSLGRYIGVAPDSRVISVKVADDTGAATESDLVTGLKWVYDNRLTYNIRAVNLSITSSVATPYTQSPINAYVEQLWMNGVAVVVAAGNLGSAADAVNYPPANDPFVITVGALDDNLTAATSDDSLAPYSSHGVTQDGFAKPEIIAPGRKIVAPLANKTVTLAVQFPDRIVDGSYLRLSGTSMAAPVVLGTLALVLERYPSLTPNQLKSLLIQTAASYPGKADPAGTINPPAALQFLASGGVLPLVNQGLVPASGVDPISGTVASTTQAYWNQAYWNQAYWNQTASLLSAAIQ